MLVSALNDRVVVQVIEKEKVTAGGLIVGENGPVKRGTILSIGPKANDQGLELGDLVAFYKGHAEQVEGRADVLTIPVVNLLYVVDEEQHKYIMLKKILCLATGYAVVLMMAALLHAVFGLSITSPITLSLTMVVGILAMTAAESDTK